MTELELTVKQAAHALGIAERTCRKWLEEGRLEGRKDRKGNRDVWRIPAEACRKVRPDVTAAQEAALGESGAASHTAELIANEVRSLREENAQYRTVLELQAQALGRLTERIATLEETLRLLPPAQEPQRRSWFSWVFKGRKKEEPE